MYVLPATRVTAEGNSTVIQPVLLVLGMATFATVRPRLFHRVVDVGVIDESLDAL